MDRNEKFRKRLENKLNQTLNKGSSKFDPTPYVNILMNEVHWENEDEDEYNLSVAKGNARAVSDKKVEKVGLVIVLLLVVIFVITPSFFYT